MEHHLILTQGGLAALATKEERAGLDRRMLEAAAASEHMVEDLRRNTPDEEFDGGSRPDADAFLQWIASQREPLVEAHAFIGRFHYSWILLELGAPGGVDDTVLAEGLQRTAESSCGLVLTQRQLEDLPDHVDALAFPQSTTDHLQRLLYARAILAMQAPCRVLFTQPDDLAQLADSSQRHAVALATELEVRFGAEAELRRTRRRAPAGLLTLLQGTTAASVPLTAQHEQLEFAFARTVALLCGHERRATAKRLQERGYDGVVLGCGSAEIASQLTPSGVQGAAPTAFDGPRPVHMQDITGRSTENATRCVAFACLHLLGDAISATPSLHAYRERHPDDHITLFVPDRAFARIFELSPDVDRLAFVSVDQQQLVFGSSTEFLEDLPEWGDQYELRHPFDIQRVARETHGVHMADGYAQLFGVQPSSRVPVLDVDLARRHSPDHLPSEPYVVLSRHTVSGLPGTKASPQGKRWNEAKWEQLAGRILKKLDMPVVSVGTGGEGRLEVPGVFELHDLSILELAGTLANARAQVTIDNGAYHLGIAMRTPLVHISPHWLAGAWTAPPDDAPHRELNVNLTRLTVTTVFDQLVELLA